MKMEKGKLARIIRTEQREMLKELTRKKENAEDDQTGGDRIC